MGSTIGSSKHHTRVKNYISWFEIPVYDIHRASTFYNAIYGIEMEVSANGEFAMAYFPSDHSTGSDAAVVGALVQGPGCYPNDTGVLIYLNAGSDMDNILGRIELAGGRIIMPKTLISDTSGHFALFIDSEGNRLALHEGMAETVKPAKAEKAAPQKASPKKKSVAKKAVKKR